MKQLTELITEMSAWHNRKNDALRSQIAKLEREMNVNKKEDKNRILKAAGISKGSKTNEVYEYAMELVSQILYANKPYGALVFLLSHLMECANKYGEKYAKAKEMGEKLAKILDSNAIDELIGNDAAFNKIKQKIDEINNKIDSGGKEINSLEEKLNELEKKYPAITYYCTR